MTKREITDREIDLIDAELAGECEFWTAQEFLDSGVSLRKIEAALGMDFDPEVEMVFWFATNRLEMREI